MILDGIMGMVAGVLDKWVSKLPGFSTNWPIAEAIANLERFLLIIWRLFPPLETAGKILLAGVAVETFLILWYWVNWLIKKIPFLG